MSTNPINTKMSDLELRKARAAASNLHTDDINKMQANQQALIDKKSPEQALAKAMMSAGLNEKEAYKMSKKMVTGKSSKNGFKAMFEGASKGCAEIAEAFTKRGIKDGFKVFAKNAGRALKAFGAALGPVMDAIWITSMVVDFFHGIVTASMVNQVNSAISKNSPLMNKMETQATRAMQTNDTTMFNSNPMSYAFQEAVADNASRLQQAADIANWTSSSQNDLNQASTSWDPTYGKKASKDINQKAQEIANRRKSDQSNYYKKRNQTIDATDKSKRRGNHDYSRSQTRGYNPAQVNRDHAKQASTQRSTNSKVSSDTYTNSHSTSSGKPGPVQSNKMTNL